MPTITITLDVPHGTTVSVRESPDQELTPEAGTVSSKQLSGAVQRYWNSYLSDNGRELYAAAAAIEAETGEQFTLEDVADRMGREYASAQSVHRTTGRSARRWRQDIGSEPPVRLDWVDYQRESNGGMRTHYRLPAGVADEIVKF
jgi:hypothetical protein